MIHLAIEFKTIWSLWRHIQSWVMMNKVRDQSSIIPREKSWQGPPSTSQMTIGKRSIERKKKKKNIYMPTHNSHVRNKITWRRRSPVLREVGRIQMMFLNDWNVSDINTQNQCTVQSSSSTFIKYEAGRHGLLFLRLQNCKKSPKKSYCKVLLEIKYI